MKKVTTLIVFVTYLLLGRIGYTQDMPPGGLIVNTRCTINQGHTFAEAVEVGRYLNNEGENAPNLIFFGSPLPGKTFSRMGSCE